MRRSKATKVCVSGLIAMCLILAGCRRPPGLQLIFIVDLTGSIEKTAQADIFAALNAVFERARRGDGYFVHLRRGDSVTVIPIASDATELQGRVLHFTLGERRESYDADLKRLAQSAQDKLQQMQQEAAVRPYSRSDLLGAIDLAVQELAQSKGRRVIVVLSDLIQDDARFDFKREARLANEASAKQLAGSLAQAHRAAFDGAFVYLGLLRSSDLKRLAPDRQAAIRAFWTEYFRQRRAEQVDFATDGSGRLAQFLERATAGKEGGKNQGSE